MTAADAVELLSLFEHAGVDVWVDGGWGVDALVGEQTRDHDDLDLVIALADSERAIAALTPDGFVVSEDERPTRFVLRDAADRRIDFHTVTFDADGGGVQQLQDGRAYRYPPEGFTGSGSIASHPVRCLTVAVQVATHVGYEPDEGDWHDMKLLHERFGVELPAPYDR